MTTGEIAGYVASALVFTTFYMKTMVPLRIVGIMSNIAFITYASLEGLFPVLILHTALLPLNVVRLSQLRAQLREIGQAVVGDFSITAILPLMQMRKLGSGDVLFRVGDPSDELYYLATGAVALPEVGAELEPGALFGEFGIFSPAGKRTATAVAKTEVTVFSIKQKDVFAALLQYPKLGILLLRLITARLLENAGKGGTQNIVEDVDKNIDPSTIPKLQATSRTASNLRLWAAILIVGASVTLIAVAFGPKFYFLIARESAVTTWLDLATSPIQGTIVTSPPLAGTRLDETGLIARIANENADITRQLRAKAAVENAEAELARLSTYMSRMQALDSEWQERTENYAAGFQDNLDIAIAGFDQEIDLLRQRVALARTSMDRKVTLGTSGTISQSAQEDARRELLDLEETLAAKEKLHAAAQLRRRLSDQGVYIETDGRSPDWAYKSRDAIRIELEQLAAQIINAESAIETARKNLVAEETGLSNVSEAQVTAPPGSTVWARLANQGEAVNVGTLIAEWIDCGELLIDVPASNVMAGLLEPGMPAQILIEGESGVHDGKVLFTRGPGAKLTKKELAAIAPGHDPNTAQAIVEFVHGDADVACPVGLAASVTFPEIGLFSLIKALFRMS